MASGEYSYLNFCGGFKKNWWGGGAGIFFKSFFLLYTKTKKSFDETKFWRKLSKPNGFWDIVKKTSRGPIFASATCYKNLAQQFLIRECWWGAPCWMSPIFPSYSTYFQQSTLAGGGYSYLNFCGGFQKFGGGGRIFSKVDFLIEHQRQ